MAERTEKDRDIARKASARFRNKCRGKDYKALQIYVPGEIRTKCRTLVKEQIIAWEMKTYSASSDEEKQK